MITKQIAVEQILRMAGMRKYPDVSTPEGKSAFVTALDEMQSFTDADACREWTTSCIREFDYFPTAREIYAGAHPINEHEWRPATDVCAWCGGTGWRRVSDNGCGVSVKCDHRAPDERVDAKQRASGEARV